MRKKKSFNSITVRITIIIVLLIFPLNILLICSTIESIHAVQRQAILSMQNISSLYLQQLDNHIDSISYYIFDKEENNPDFICMTQQMGDNAYALSKYAVGNDFSFYSGMEGKGDAFFCYAENLKDFMLIMPQGYDKSISGVQLTKVHDKLQTTLRTLDFSQFRQWRIFRSEGTTWLMKVFQYGHYYCGAMISVDRLRMNILQALHFKSCRITIDENPLASIRADRLGVDAASSKAVLYIRLSISKTEALQTLPIIQWFGIVMAFAYLMLIPALLHVLNRMLLVPLHKIQSALLRMKTGEQEYRISYHNYADEFRSINQSFNEMADNIQNLKIANYEQKLERKNLEIRNLQLQIRPHFLLNTFNLLFNLAQIGDFANIKSLSLYLADYFRYIFRSGKDMEPFSQEYDLIRKYLDVSQIRYPNSYRVEYDIDDLALDVGVPPLLIHNFVENILSHGLVYGRLVHIKLSAHCRDDYAEFIISDDGAGMNPAMVDDINSGQFACARGGGTHLGIYNSYQRLLCFYGSDSRLSVTSEIGKGSRFVITFRNIEAD